MFVIARTGIGHYWYSSSRTHVNKNNLIVFLFLSIVVMVGKDDFEDIIVVYVGVWKEKFFNNVTYVYIKDNDILVKLDLSEHRLYIAPLFFLPISQINDDALPSTCLNTTCEEYSLTRLKLSLNGLLQTTSTKIVVFKLDWSNVFVHSPYTSFRLLSFWRFTYITISIITKICL